jgi:type II secretory ATPase GspE/PulE/Tfp pilus assembly ATPase PilB-like protein
MVGEIRDRETAEVAVHAALTGHLVLSTLHTNNSAGTLPRLKDMGIEPFLIASTTNIIISQRLVRKVCSECRQDYKLDDDSYKSLSQNFDIDSITEVLKREKIIKKEYKSSKEMWLNFKFVQGKGCSKCRNEGYKGRIGIFEVLKVDDKIGRLINSGATGEEIEEEAIKSGMTTMLEDGFIKAINGVTTIEEIIRVTKE